MNRQTRFLRKSHNLGTRVVKGARIHSGNSTPEDPIGRCLQYVAIIPTKGHCVNSAKERKDSGKKPASFPTKSR